MQISREELGAKGAALRFLDAAVEGARTILGVKSAPLAIARLLSTLMPR